MDAGYWHQKWETRQIGFHQARPNPLLVTHFDRLSLPTESRIFVPLCGKSLDVLWLKEQGHTVCGAELSEIAVQELFSDAGLTPVVSPLGALSLYQAPGLEIFVGDIFALDATALGPIDAVFDRAAYVALPESVRPRYAKHVAEITDHAQQLLITFEYDQKDMPGPPFSIPQTEVGTSFGVAYELDRLVAVNVEGGLKGICRADEVIWHLHPRPGVSPRQ